jgi:hypothetical protein
MDIWEISTALHAGVYVLRSAGGCLRSGGEPAGLCGPRGTPALRRELGVGVGASALAVSWRVFAVRGGSWRLFAVGGGSQGEPAGSTVMSASVAAPAATSTGCCAAPAALTSQRPSGTSSK